jgi:hypothetical protein
MLHREPDYRYALPRRAEGQSVSSHWRKNRNVLIWILHKAGASQRAIAYGHDLSRSQVRAIIKRFCRNPDNPFGRPPRRNPKILSPVRHVLNNLRQAKR